MFFRKILMKPRRVAFSHIAVTDMSHALLSVEDTMPDYLRQDDVMGHGHTHLRQLEIYAKFLAYQRPGVAPVNRLVPRAFHQFTHARSKAHARPGISYVQPERNRLRFASSQEAIGRNQ